VLPLVVRLSVSAHARHVAFALPKRRGPASGGAFDRSTVESVIAGIDFVAFIVINRATAWRRVARDRPHLSMPDEPTPR